MGQTGEGNKSKAQIFIKKNTLIKNKSCSMTVGNRLLQFQGGLYNGKSRSGRFLGQDMTLIQYSSRYTEAKKGFKWKRGQTKGGQQVL